MTWRDTLSRHCEPAGRANARPMTGPAKQSSFAVTTGKLDCFVASLLAMTAESQNYTLSCRHPRKRVIQYSKDADDRTEKPRRTGSSAFAEDDELSLTERRALPLPQFVIRGLDPRIHHLRKSFL